MIEDFVNKIHVGHVIDVLKQIPGNSIDVCVTSPPYWGLRNYGDCTNVKWDDGYEGQLGLEPHPQMYINHIVQIMREVRRVLKDTGTLWLNIGDTMGSFNKRKYIGILKRNLTEEEKAYVIKELVNREIL